jgi:hypothetical protein
METYREIHNFATDPSLATAGGSSSTQEASSSAIPLDWENRLVAARDNGKTPPLRRVLEQWHRFRWYTLFLQRCAQPTIRLKSLSSACIRRFGSETEKALADQSEALLDTQADVEAPKAVTSIQNPSTGPWTNEDRTKMFKWVLGSDHDDHFTALQLTPKDCMLKVYTISPRLGKMR